MISLLAQKNLKQILSELIDTDIGKVTIQRNIMTIKKIEKKSYEDFKTFNS